MPTVETTITVSIPEGGASWGEAEERAAEAVQSAGRELMVVACRALEEEASGALRRRGQVQRVKLRPLEILARFGWVRLERRQVVERRQGGSQASTRSIRNRIVPAGAATSTSSPALRSITARPTGEAIDILPSVGLTSLGLTRT